MRHLIIFVSLNRCPGNPESDLSSSLPTDGTLCLTANFGSCPHLSRLDLIFSCHYLLFGLIDPAHYVIFAILGVCVCLGLTSNLFLLFFSQVGNY